MAPLKREESSDEGKRYALPKWQTILASTDALRQAPAVALTSFNLRPAIAGDCGGHDGLAQQDRGKVNRERIHSAEGAEELNEPQLLQKAFFYVGDL